MQICTILCAAALLISGGPAAAATDGYCTLWSRAVAELEVRAGKQLSLIFKGADLVFTERPDVDIATASARLVALRAKSHYSDCRLLVEYDTLPLPDLPAAHADQWASMVSLYAIGRQGTAPAAADPTPGRGSPEWRAACAAEYRTWDEADGTVIRRGSPERVRCPLKLIDGAWRIPE
jgi:hypothetical protein